MIVVWRTAHHADYKDYESLNKLPIRFVVGAHSRILALALILPAATLLVAAASPQGKSRPRVQPTVVTSAAKPDTKGADAGFTRTVLPVIKQYCVGCHAGKAAAAGIDLSSAKNAGAVLGNRSAWDRVAQNVASSHMPPTGSPAPTKAQRDALVDWVQSTTSAADCSLNDPGHVTLRRLNRAEYNNTMRDLCGVDIRPADGFPNDDVGYGFDNIGDVLSISPLLMEKYLAAAGKVAHAAFLSPDDMVRPVVFEPTLLTYVNQSVRTGDHAVLGAANSEINCDYTFPTAAEYILRVPAWQSQAGPEAAKMQMMLDGREIAVKSVGNQVRNPRDYEARLAVTAGKHRFGIVFTNPFHDDSEATGRQNRNRNRDRKLNVRELTIVGPLQGAKAPSPLMKLLGNPEPDEASRPAVARTFLSEFARRAYRRPAAPDEVDKLVKYADLARAQGQNFQQSLEYAMSAAMCSPNFLFRVETEILGVTSVVQPVVKAKGKSGLKPAALKTPAPKNGASKAALNDYAIASRLSYFLWSSMPDEALFGLAAKGRLHDPVVLAAQARRMLKDPRSSALAENFAGQWLQLRLLNSISPDVKRFTDFDDGLRQAMKTETELFFQSIVQEDHNLFDFLDARYTFLNEQLAKHYGIEGVSGGEFRRVTLSGDQRGGILTQASLLTVTSNPSRTSPVKRGKWVMENLLGTPLPPPPPDVPALADDKQGPLVGTLRQRMEQHRSNPICASCHAGMDPIGFGLENYDAVGKWRATDGDAAIDSSGVLPDGSKFSGPAQLKQILMAKKSQFMRCLAEKLMTYALGRGLARTDKCNMDEVVNGTIKEGSRFSGLVAAIVKSEPFREQRRDKGD